MENIPIRQKFNQYKNELRKNNYKKIFQKKRLKILRNLKVKRKEKLVENTTKFFEYQQFELEKSILANNQKKVKSLLYEVNDFLTEKKDQYTIREFYKSKIIQIFIKLIDINYNKDEEIIKLTLNVLGNILYYSYTDNFLMIIQKGIFQNFKILLKMYNKDITESIGFILANMISNKKNDNIINLINTNSLWYRIIDSCFVFKEDNDVKLRYSLFFSNLWAGGFEDKEIELKFYNYIPYFFTDLNNHELLTDGLYAILKFIDSVNKKERTKKLLDTGIVPFFSKIISKKINTLIAPILKIMAIYSSCSEEYINMFYDEELNKSLIYIIINEYQEDIITDAIFVIGNLFVTNNNIKESFMKKNLLNIIFSKILESDSLEIIYYCISFLEFYVDNENYSQKVKFVHDQQIFQIFLHVLNSKYNEKIILNILVILDSLLYKLINNNNKVFNEDLFYYLKNIFYRYIENFKNYKNEEISNLAEDILLEFFNRDN